MQAFELLTLHLQEAGIPVVGVADSGNGTYRIDFAPEATQEQRSQAAAIVAAFDPALELAALEAAEAAERADLVDLLPKIATELAYIGTTRGTIDTMTAGQVRDVVKRLLQEQEVELKAWRYVIRRLK